MRNISKGTYGCYEDLVRYYHHALRLALLPFSTQVEVSSVLPVRFMREVSNTASAKLNSL